MKKQFSNLEWIEHIKLKSKDYSGSEHCSFLVQKENLYFMDNHRLALWCWQHYLNTSVSKTSINIAEEQTFNFLHIDAHEDAKDDIEKTWWTKIQGMSLEKYLSEPSPHGKYLHFRWDNYLPVFIHADQKLIRKSVFVTHEVGLAGYCHQRIKSYGLLQEFPKLFVDELKWIINLDLDYFYAREYKNSMMFNHDWIRQFFSQLKHQYDLGDIALITIALSPECCGDWKNSELVLALFDEIFDTKIINYLSQTSL